MIDHELHLIAAVGSDGGIGYKNELLFHDPLDMAWFYNITLGHTVIMGRHTYQSIGGPLPNRRNIVLSRTAYGPNGWLRSPAPEIVTELEQLDTKLDQSEPAYVIGGAEIYKQLMPYARYIHLTEFFEVPEHKPDAFFPPIDENIWKVTSSVVAGTFADGGVRMRFSTFRRK